MAVIYTAPLFRLCTFEVGVANVCPTPVTKQNPTTTQNPQSSTSTPVVFSIRWRNFGVSNVRQDERV